MGGTWRGSKAAREASKASAACPNSKPASTPAPRHAHLRTCRHRVPTPSARTKEEAGETRPRRGGGAPRRLLHHQRRATSCSTAFHPDATPRSELSSLACRHGATGDCRLKTRRIMTQDALSRPDVSRTRPLAAHSISQAAQHKQRPFRCASLAQHPHHTGAAFDWVLLLLLLLGSRSGRTRSLRSICQTSPAPPKIPLLVSCTVHSQSARPWRTERQDREGSGHLRPVWAGPSSRTFPAARRQRQASSSKGTKAARIAKTRDARYGRQRVGRQTEVGAAVLAMKACVERVLEPRALVVLVPHVAYSSLRPEGQIAAPRVELIARVEQRGIAAPARVHTLGMVVNVFPCPRIVKAHPHAPRRQARCGHGTPSRTRGRRGVAGQRAAAGKPGGAGRCRGDAPRYGRSMRSSMQYDERRISSRALRLKTQFVGVEQLPSRQRVVPPRSIPPAHRAGSPRSALPKSPASQVPGELVNETMNSLSQ